MGRTALVLSKVEFQSVVTDLGSKHTFSNLGELWKAIEATSWAKSQKPRPLTASVAALRAADIGIVINTEPGRRTKKMEAKASVPTFNVGKATLQMDIVDLEFEGALPSFDVLCMKLAEKYKVASHEVKSMILKGSYVTKTPKGSAVKPEWDDDEDDDEHVFEEPIRIMPKPGTTVIPLPKVEEKPLERCIYSDRYKQEWKKWFDRGVEDRIAGKAEDASQIPTRLPIAEDLPNLSGDKPVTMWFSAYRQGFSGYENKFIYPGQIIPTVAAKNLTWEEWQENCTKDATLSEMF